VHTAPLAQIDCSSAQIIAVTVHRIVLSP